jgi:biotin transport system substrate-specific component
MVYASMFAALTAAGAWAAIPLPFVPITLQTFFVVLAGAVLGAYYGALSMIV